MATVGLTSGGGASGVRDTRDYILGGAVHNIRYDGRANTDFRAWKIENNILPHVNGSARVSVCVGGSTASSSSSASSSSAAVCVDVVCAVKLEIGDPEVSAPDQGRLEVNVDVSDLKDEGFKSEIAMLLHRFSSILWLLPIVVGWLLLSTVCTVQDICEFGRSGSERFVDH
jgi:hypothetical protein